MDSMRYPEAYSNNTTITPTLGADSGTTNSGGGWSSGGGSGGYSRGLNVKAQISVERLPYDYSVENIRTIFGRYGRISRVVCDYRISEERLYVWIDYEDERVVDNALRNENGRKVGRQPIIVQKCQNSGSDGDSYRKTANKDAWGNKSFGARGGDNNNSFSSTNDDWGSSDTTADWGSSDDKRGRGGSRGGRGGGRGGRGGRGGSRYQPYDKSAPADWDSLVSGSKASASNDANSFDWGSSGATDDWGNSDTTNTTSNQTTSQSSTAADPFDGWD